MPPGRFAHQEIRVEVRDGAELEFYPGLTIPYPRAAYRQRIDIDLASGARFATLESWATGRVGRGESFSFQVLSSRIRIRRGSI